MRHEEVVKELLEIINVADISKGYKTKIKKELIKERKEGKTNLSAREIEKESIKRMIEFLQELKKYGKEEEIEHIIELYSKDL